MRAIVQRVESSYVSIGGKIHSDIGHGLNVLLGVTHDDSVAEAQYLADKIVKLRIFSDENDKMNLSLQDIGGEILVVSQFTLYGDCRKGNRPSFTDSAEPEKAEILCEYFISYLRDQYKLSVGTGVFGADMKVGIENDGPVTIFIDSDMRKRPR